MATMLSSARCSRSLYLLSVLAVGGLVAAAAPAAASPRAAARTPVRAAAVRHHTKKAVGTAPVKAGSHYLALGDSVSFGYRESDSNPSAPDYTKASNFAGYPEYVSRALGLRLANASCPGETSTSFLDAKAESFKCENQDGQPGGYRQAYPLHVKYKGSQLAYAVGYLKKHHDTRLVSLTIGANDGFQCQATTSDHCTSESELIAVFAKVAKNVKTILSTIRSKAKYTGQIVIVNYYSIDYTDAIQNGLTNGLNSNVDDAAKPYHVRVADSFDAFKAAAGQASGSTCNAGLLTTLSDSSGCGVHPSVAGQQVLAQTAEAALRK